MNNAIRHAAGPKSFPTGEGGGGFRGLPKEALAMARQMGLTPADLKQIDGMWASMDDLAETDPATYRKMVEDTLAQGPPDKADRRPGEAPPRFFTPRPGFVVKTRTVHEAGQGLRVRTGNAESGNKLFVNVASHEALETPKDLHGRPVQDGERRAADGLQMPLVVGQPRRCADHTGDAAAAQAVDVVFHPWVMARCADDSMFKAQVIELALGWVEQELSFKLEKRWKLINAQYKGGLGERKAGPLPFPVADADLQSHPMDQRPPPSTADAAAAAAQGQEAREPHGARDADPARAAVRPVLATSSPQDLIAAAAGEVAGGASGGAEEGQASPPATGSGVGALRMPAAGTAPGVGARGARARGPLIEEITPPSAPVAADRRPIKASKAKDPARPAVKAGFLRSKNGKKAVRLYGEEGSRNGGQEGSYSRLMSKCKVVDMSSMPPEQQQQAMRAHAGGGAPGAGPLSSSARPPPATVPSAGDTATAGATSGPSRPGPAPEARFDGIGKGFLDGTRPGAKGAAPLYGDTGIGRGGAQTSDPVFDSLIAGVDPDYANASKPMGDPQDTAMFGALADIAKVIGGGGTSLAADLPTPPVPAPFQAPTDLDEPAPQVTSAPASPAAADRAPAVSSPANPQDTNGESKAQRAADPSLAYTLDVDGGCATAHLVVNLHDVQGGMKHVNLEVGKQDHDGATGTTVRVHAPARSPLQVQLPFMADPARTVAKFSKKKKKLDVAFFPAEP